MGKQAGHRIMAVLQARLVSECVLVSVPDCSRSCMQCGLCGGKTAGVRGVVSLGCIAQLLMVCGLLSTAPRRFLGVWMCTRAECLLYNPCGVWLSCPAVWAVGVMMKVVLVSIVCTT